MSTLISSDIFNDLKTDIKNWMDKSMNIHNLSLETKLSDETKKVDLVARILLCGPNSLVLWHKNCSIEIPPNKALKIQTPSDMIHYRTGPTPTCKVEIDGDRDLCQKLIDTISALGITITQVKPYDYNAISL